MNSVTKHRHYSDNPNGNGTTTNGIIEPAGGALEMSDLNNNNDDTLPLVPHQQQSNGVLVAGSSPAAANVDSHGMAAGTASNSQVAVNIIISFVGAGLLGVPNAFQQSGWLLGSVALCTVSALNVYAMLLIPQVKRQLQKTMAENTTNNPAGGDSNKTIDNNNNNDGTTTNATTTIESYGDLGRVILGRRGESFVNICLIISQVGFATAYIIFIAANMYSIARVPRLVSCLLCIPGLCALVQAREMKTLSPFSLLADFANLLGLSAVLLEDWERYIPHNDHIHAVRWEGLLYVIAITIYSMEGVGLILSLETSCQNPSSFNNLFRLVLTCITLFMSFFGTAGYMGFGDETQAPITLNLSGSWTATLVKSALCLALYLTYPVMMFPVWTILEEQIAPRARDDAKFRVTLRCSLVVATALVAYSVPDFGKFLSLVGSSICTILGFILPCYFHYATLKADLRLWQVVLDFVLMFGGAVFGVLGTVQSVQKLMRGEDLGE